MQIIARIQTLTSAVASYISDLSIETQNMMTASLLKLFFKKQLKADVRLEENKLIIENRPVTESKIIEIIKSLYNY